MNMLEKAKLWLSDSFDEETRKAVEMLIKSESPDPAYIYSVGWCLRP